MAKRSRLDVLALKTELSQFLQAELEARKAMIGRFTSIVGTKRRGATIFRVRCWDHRSEQSHWLEITIHERREP